MFALRSLLIIGVFCISSVVSEKKICDFEDSKCLTEAANRVFAQIISGMPGVESSDPLHEDLIDANLPSITYKIIDAHLSGLKKCNVKLVKYINVGEDTVGGLIQRSFKDNVWMYLQRKERQYCRIYTKDEKYDYHIGCPHLTLESGYELKAETGTQIVEGKGNSKIDLYDYHLFFHGDFVINEGKEGKMHLNLKTHELVLKLKGKVHYNYKNLFLDDKEKSDALQKFANENWESVVKRTLQPVMEAFMNKHINNKNAYLAIVPIQDIFFDEK